MKTAVAATGLVLAVVAGASAGEIVLKNGSRLSGELANESMLVSTSSGALEVAGSDIRVLTPTEVRLKDGRVIQGTIVGQTVRARTPLGELAIQLDELASFRAEPDTPPKSETAPRIATAPSPAAPGPTPPASSLAPAGGLPPASPSRPGSGDTAVGVGPAPAVPQTASPPVGGDATAGAPPADNGVGGPTQVVNGAQAIGHGVATTAKGIGHTVVQGADAAHDGFKSFGLKVRDVFMGIGQVFQNAFGS
ncbi:MAG: hypothetical protein DMD79_04145 [Candidatus Rokuibacteriota bacterium]|nr:MAG: hypothetical protein DMD79_04145 [Candidatus Rokubacteria bacterium]